MRRVSYDENLYKFVSRVINSRKHAVAGETSPRLCEEVDLCIACDDHVFNMGLHVDARDINVGRIMSSYQMINEYRVVKFTNIVWRFL